MAPKHLSAKVQQKQPKAAAVGTVRNEQGVPVPLTEALMAMAKEEQARSTRLLLLLLLHHQKKREPGCAFRNQTVCSVSTALCFTA
jgi:hypothetical protein